MPAARHEAHHPVYQIGTEDTSHLPCRPVLDALVRSAGVSRKATDEEHPFHLAHFPTWNGAKQTSSCLSGWPCSSVDTDKHGRAVGHGTAKRKEKRRPILTSTLQSATHVPRQQQQFHLGNCSKSPFSGPIPRPTSSQPPREGPASYVLTRSLCVTKV